MNSQERLSALSKIVIEISQALNAEYTRLRPWTFVTPDPDSYGVCLRDAGNGRIWFQFVSSTGYDKNDRLHISGDLNIGKNRSYVEVRDENYNRISAGEITVAVNRGAKVIAREIAGRLLPHYLDVLQKANEKLQKDADYEAKIKANIRRIATALEFSTVAEYDHRGELNRSLTLKTHGHYHTVKVNSDDVDMALGSLTFEQAEHIIAYLKKGVEQNDNLRSNCQQRA